MSLELRKWQFSRGYFVTVLINWIPTEVFIKGEYLRREKPEISDEHTLNIDGRVANLFFLI
jgi:hypothetical protein